ncbi:MAG: hypothetical protein AAF998_23305 [Bacteroidota bacterium]
MEAVSDPQLDLAPANEFARHSPILIRLGLTSKVLCALIRAKAMDGERDGNGLYWTYKAAILKFLDTRNKEGLSRKINLEDAEKLISCIPLQAHKR